MHPFSKPGKNVFKGVGKGCIENKWVKFCQSADFINNLLAAQQFYEQAPINFYRLLG